MRPWFQLVSELLPLGSLTWLPDYVVGLVSLYVPANPGSNIFPLPQLALGTLPFNDIDLLSQEARDVISQNLDMIRLPVTSKLPHVISSQEIIDKQREHCSRWLRGLCLRGPWLCLLSRLPPVPRQATRHFHTPDHTRSLLEAPMQLLDKLIPDIPLDMLVIIEDKDPSVLWLASVAGMYKDGGAAVPVPGKVGGTGDED